MPEAEWDAFLAALRRPLPLAFRVNGAGPFAASLTAEMEAGLGGVWPASGAPLVLPGGEPPIPAPARLPWYPGGLAWSMTIPRGVLRKHPALAAAHARLTAAHDGGRVTRQEAVSMIPPLLLDVRPHHLVLDACASPGSKTAQLLEMLHTNTFAVGAAGGAGGAGGGGEGRGEGTGPTPTAAHAASPTGAVVANDKDPSRCNMLAHQVARCPSPALVVTCHDAAFYPTPGGGGGGGGGGAGGMKGAKGTKGGFLRFDRVLADVPCSGDGTLRKAVDLWRRWTPAAAVGLHPLQLRIAARGAALLGVGGRLVYSTCSLNPIEDEAVVAALLTASKGALVLADVSGELPGLARSPGLARWVVPCVRGAWEAAEDGGGGGKKKGRGSQGGQKAAPAAAAAAAAAAAEPAPPSFVSTWAEAQALPGGAPAKLRASMFPPPAPAADDCDTEAGGGNNNADPLNLHRCIRVLPHSGDTGGFFVAVLDKVGEMPGAAKEAAGAAGTAPAPAAAAEEEEGEGEGEGVGEQGTPPGAAAAAPAPGGEAAAAAPAAAPATAPTAAPPVTSKTWGGADPVTEVDAGGELTADLAREFGLPTHAPPLSALVVRSVEGVAAPRRVFAVSPGVQALLRADAGSGGRLKVVAAGVKVFERADGRGGAGGCNTASGALRYRPASDGAAYLARARPGRQVAGVTPGEMLALLEGRVVGLPDEAKLEKERGGGRAGGAGEQAGPPPLPALPPRTAALPAWADPATVAALPTLSHGGCVITLREPDATALGLPVGGPAAGLATAAWRGRASVSLSIPAIEASARAGVLRRAMVGAGMEVPAVPAVPVPIVNVGAKGGGGGEPAAAKKAKVGGEEVEVGAVEAVVEA